MKLRTDESETQAAGIDALRARQASTGLIFIVTAVIGRQPNLPSRRSEVVHTDDHTHLAVGIQNHAG